MDGYAIRFEANNPTRSFQVINEIKAGDNIEPKLQPGEAVRIFTGAPVPSTANAVIMQEETTRTEQSLSISREVIKEGLNIRPQGEQIMQGQVALKAGTVINGAAIGFLQTLGLQNIWVYSRPSVSVIVTGQELATPGEALVYGQIYESNSAMLDAMVKSTGIEKVEHGIVQDSLESTIEMIEAHIEQSDMLILSGGISVGDYDFVGKALMHLGCQQVFYKIKQKPGKPLFFGMLRNKPVFALPGNPASAWVCYLMYVQPALRLMKGVKDDSMLKLSVPLTAARSKKGNRAEFLKAHLNNGVVSVLGSQSSAMLNSASEANALVYLPPDKSEFEEGDFVETYMIPTLY